MDKNIEKKEIFKQKRISLDEEITSILRDYIDAQNVAYILFYGVGDQIAVQRASRKNAKETVWSIAKEEYLNSTDERDWLNIEFNICLSNRDLSMKLEVWAKHLELSIDQMRKLAQTHGKFPKPIDIDFHREEFFQIDLYSPNDLRKIFNAFLKENSRDEITPIEDGSK